jgi:hypothetical protein
MRGIEVEISLPGNERRLKLPIIEAGRDIRHAVVWLNRWKNTEAAPYDVLARAYALCEHIAREATP